MNHKTQLPLSIEEQTTSLSTASASTTTLAQPLIQLRQVVKVYQSAAGEYTALKGITANVFPGEFVGVIGKSGAGKTTLLNMITGVDQITEGEVIFNGHGAPPISVHQLSENALALWRGRNLGIIHQSFQLLPQLTLVENILLPQDFCGNYQPKVSRKRALELLELVDLSAHANKLPAYISGGQKQRVAIARALVNDPPVIVADEPTGSLDTLTAGSIFEIFESLVQQGRTIVMVTHDNNLAPRFSYRLHISDGAISGESGR
ncbi:MAG: ABC transporter ATP-binding protein [Anaerolineales bacterium]|jgi:putative ABC transport system ATP-binding protein|nr:ABC transporter ATP-binding protein [Anaerolineales bacterium]